MTNIGQVVSDPAADDLSKMDHGDPGRSQGSAHVAEQQGLGPVLCHGFLPQSTITRSLPAHADEMRGAISPVSWSSWCATAGESQAQIFFDHHAVDCTDSRGATE